MIDKESEGRTNGEPTASVAALVLVVLAAAIFACRIRYFHEPFENDLTIRMAYAARSVAGARYYSDLFVFGPAGALWINEVFYRLAGASELSVYLMGCSFSALTLLGVYRCARLLTDVRGGLIAAAAWTLVSSDLFTQANQPNSEVFINAALVWAFAQMLDQRGTPSPWRLVMAGLLFFLASSVKHTVALTPVLAAAFAAFLPAKRRDSGSVKFDAKPLHAWAIVGVVALTAWALLLGWYAATDRLGAVLGALFGSSIVYATQQESVLDNVLAGMHPYELIPTHQLPFVLLYSCLLAAVVGGLLGTGDQRWRMVLGWALGTWFSISLPGRFFAHYYMLWLPLISIGTGAAFRLTHTMPRQRLAFGLRAGIALALLVVGVRQVSQLVRYDAETAVLAKYGDLGAKFAEIRTLGKRLAESVAPTSSVFEIGAHGLYFYAAHPAPGPFVDSLYGIGSAFPTQYVEKMLPVLLQSPPDVLVVRRSFLRSNVDLALRDCLTQVLDRVPYAEDKALSGQYLLVLRRRRTDVRPPGG